MTVLAPSLYTDARQRIASAAACRSTFFVRDLRIFFQTRKPAYLHGSLMSHYSFQFFKNLRTGHIALWASFIQASGHHRFKVWRHRAQDSAVALGAAPPMGVQRVLSTLRARGGRHAPAATLLALSLLLLLLGHWTSNAPPPNPRVVSLVRSTNHTATSVHSQLVTEPRVLRPSAVPAASEMVARTTEEPLPAGAVLARSRYVEGHARAHAELCAARGARLRLVVLVSSAPANAAAREAVRFTWGHAARRADVALAFVLGAPPPYLRAKLDKEDALYGDLVEGRFVDSYLNLTLKTLSMLEWVETYCPLAPRLLKTDDDMFINVNGLLRFAEEPARRAANATVWGKVWRNGRPVRDVFSKFFVPPSEFPEKKYPPYANGPAYLMTAAAAGRLRRAAHSARFLRMEDVFVTGVLAERARVRRVDAPQFHNRLQDVAQACALRRALAVHQVRYHEQFDLWRKLLDGKAKCPT